MSYGRYTIAKSFAYEQTTASDTWTIDHTIFSTPMVDVKVHDPDNGGALTKIIPLNVEVITASQLVITFTQPYTGVALLVG